jgi:hypothetical protein
VVQRDPPQVRLECGHLALAVGDQFTDAIALVAARQRPVPRFQQHAHVGGHRRQIEGRADEGVVEVEDT